MKWNLIFRLFKPKNGHHVVESETQDFRRGYEMTHLAKNIYPEVVIARSVKWSGVLEGGSWPESHRRL